MSNYLRSRARREARRGATLILTVFTLFVLFTFLAFSVDSGFLAGARAEMRRTADAASLAGCWEMYRQLQAGATHDAAKPPARQAAADYVLLNRVTNSDVVADASPTSREIEVGYVASLNDSILTQNSALPFMAVKVSVLKSKERNGEVPFFFGKIFGRSGQQMQASATSVMAQKISGFSLPPGSADKIKILPFALDLQSWTAMKECCGPDNYRFDAQTGQIVTGSDGLREVNMYPQGMGSPGNRGTVDIGGANNSTADLARQISSGISRDDLQQLGKPLKFQEGTGLTLNGDTGISAGVKDEIAGIIGQTRIIPVFSTVTGNGNNASYTIVKWVGVRVLAVKLTGAMSQKMVMVQPAPIISRNVVVDVSSESSDGVFSPVLLVE